MKSFLTKILNVVYPPKCLVCRVYIANHGSFCKDCWSDLHFITMPCCRICCFPFEYEMGADQICAACQKQKPDFDKLLSVFQYRGVIRKLIINFKHKDCLLPVARLAEFMRLFASDVLEDFDYMAVVPLHKTRLIKRKYNQSAILASRLSKNVKVKYFPDLLLKVKKTKNQSGLSLRSRQKNLVGSFVINHKYKNHIKGKSIVVIDDVYTTGATLNYCAKILKRHGASKVYALTLAKVLRKRVP